MQVLAMGVSQHLASTNGSLSANFSYEYCRCNVVMALMSPVSRKIICRSRLCLIAVLPPHFSRIGTHIDLKCQMILIRKPRGHGHICGQSTLILSRWWYGAHVALLHICIDHEEVLHGTSCFVLGARKGRLNGRLKVGQKLLMGKES